MTEKFKVEKDYTQTPDVYFDSIMGKLTDGEWKVLSVIIRKTIGFGKMSDKIAMSQMLTLTGYTQRTSVLRVRKSLAEKGLISFDRSLGGQTENCTEYRIVLPERVSLIPVVNKTPVSKTTDTRVLNDVTPVSKTTPTIDKDYNRQSTIHTERASASPARVTELIKQYSEQVQKVDRIALDYRLKQAENANGAQTVEHCLEAIIQAAQDPEYPKDKLPGSLSTLLGTFDRVEWWAKRYKKPDLQWWDTNTRESVIETLATYIKWGKEIPEPIKHLEADARRVFENRQVIVPDEETRKMFAGVA